jgi:hypothetical protein
MVLCRPRPKVKSLRPPHQNWAILRILRPGPILFEKAPVTMQAPPYSEAPPHSEAPPPPDPAPSCSRDAAAGESLSLFPLSGAPQTEWWKRSLLSSQRWGL